MTFEKYLEEWYKQHPFAKRIDNKCKAFPDSQCLDSSTLIIQKLDWLQYCKENRINVDDTFCDTLFEELKFQLKNQVIKHGTIQFGEFIDLFTFVSSEKAASYDTNLLLFVNGLLKELHLFEDMHPLHSSWMKMRMDFLEEIHLGFPAPESTWIPSHYIAHRKDFLRIRDTDFSEMWNMACYFLKMYYYCKTMDRCSMAGDIVKVHDFILSFLRDLLVSARSNGYYEYEEKIIQRIEDIKAETSYTPSVFISYNWEDGEIADKIELAISDNSVVHRDKHDVEEGDNLKRFMKSIRQQDFAILIVSDKYLESRNCMYEILQLLKDYEEDEKLFWNKVILFVTATDVYNGQGRAKKIKYWADACEQYEKILNDIPEPAKENSVKEAKILRYISMEIDKLLEHINDVKCDRDIDDFIEHTNNRLVKWAQYGDTPIKDALMAYFQNRRSNID